VVKISSWAEIDENNIVTRVLVGDNNDPNGDEGYQWLIDNLGGRWIKTSYNASIRKNYAGIGFAYDEDLDAFIPPKPYDSWILNEDTALWEPPIPKPNDDKMYVWNEESVSWAVVND
jgi:hypothetical protein